MRARESATISPAVPESVGLVLYQGHGYRVRMGKWSPHLIVERWGEEGWEYVGEVHPLDLARYVEEALREP